MKCYIQVKDGQTVGYPYAEDNIRHLPAEIQASLVEVVRTERLRATVARFCPDEPVYVLLDGRAVETWPTRPWTEEERAAMAPTESKPAHPIYEQAASQVRGLRYQILKDCDWTQIADAKLTDEQRAAWSAYRQALRDVPEQPEFPWQVTWPTAP
jgi:hypothetical protein